MDGKKFMLDVSSSGAVKLSETVKEKLSEYIGNDTDDVLVEYIIVLVGHGKEKSQAVKDLEAFLGSDSESFVSWLWNHMSSNKHLYMEGEIDKPSEVAFIEDNTPPQVEPILRSVVAVIEQGKETTTQMELEEQAEDPGMVGMPKSADEGAHPEDECHTSVQVDHSFKRRGRRRENTRHTEAKRPRSPEIWTRRGRGRADRPDMKEMSPPVVKASRRLLITAVREVVVESALLATKKDALRRTESAKRLQSVVSSDADVQEIGGPEVEMTHADASSSEPEQAAMEEPPVSRTSLSQERRSQERHPSVWDRLTERSHQVIEQDCSRSLRAEESPKIENEATAVEAVNPSDDHVDNRGKWKKNHVGGYGPAAGQVKGTRGHKYNGVVQRPARKLEVNGHLLGDALRRINLEQIRNHDSIHRNPVLASRKQLGINSGHESSEAYEGEGGDMEPVFNSEDVLEMKKRLRQVQLDMTKLRARQAEVTKEVQKAPVAGARAVLFQPQPSQEDINSRSIFVSNVHFAATQGALRAHFDRCGIVNRVTLLVEAASGKPKGSAYVEFATRDAVENALALNESTLLSRPLKVMRKDDAVAEMITPPVLLPNPWPHPPIPRPYLREHIPPRKLYPVRRPSGLAMPHTGASNLKWKRDASATTGTSNEVAPLTNGERSNLGPVRLTKSLSYVRVAPYAIQGTRGTVNPV